MAQTNSDSDKTIYLGDFSSGNKGWQNRLRDWFNANRNTVITTVVVLLIVVVAVFLSQQSRQTKESETQKPTGQELKIDQGAAPQDNTKAEKTLATERVVTKESITVKAGKGDGITHLARSALQGYLEENPENKAKLSKEHKIYIEDYLKDKKVAERNGKKTLQIGEEVTFDKNLIKEAVDSSLQLKDFQLKNIQVKYSPLVSSL